MSRRLRSRSPPYIRNPSPRRRNEPQHDFVPKISGYRVENTVKVTARRIDKLGELLDSLVQAGANQIHGISFRVGDPEKLLDEARRRAVADAQSQGRATRGRGEGGGRQSLENSRRDA